MPFVGRLAAWFERVAARRWGRVPIGLVGLLPLAILIDVFDAADELFGGPIGIAASFLVESAYLLALTGSVAPSLAFAAIDLIPFVDVLPIATIVTLREIARAWGDEPRGREGPRGPVIDV